MVQVDDGAEGAISVGRTEEMITALSALVSSDVQVFGAFLGRRAVMGGWQFTPEGEKAIEALRLSLEDALR